jgi:hypothetical protein
LLPGAAEAEMVEDLADRHLRLMRWPQRVQTSKSTW